MPTLKTYQKAEKACIDAGFLCSMGIEAVVCQDDTFGEILCGVIESPIYIEVPDAQMEQAAALLDKQRVEEPTITPPQLASLDSISLHRFFRFILIYDLACYIIFFCFGHLYILEPPPSVMDFLTSLAFSDVLWWLAYTSHWPLIITGMLSNVLCFFYLPLGRTLFAFTTVWGIVLQLGPPPIIFNPYYGFLGSIQVTLTSMALSLMYWSPLRERFTTRSNF
jgi:hypothetical protein